MSRGLIISSAVLTVLIILHEALTYKALDDNLVAE
jgi:hypothetical protein